MPRSSRPRSNSPPERVTDDVLARTGRCLWAIGDRDTRPCVAEMRDMEETLEEARGGKLLVRAADAEMTETLWEQQEGSGQRDSSESEFEVECLLLDVAHESTSRQRSARRLWMWRSQVCSASGPRERPAPKPCFAWPWATRNRGGLARLPYHHHIHVATRCEDPFGHRTVYESSLDPLAQRGKR